MGLQGWQWLIIALIILLLFGAPKLPKLAKSMGESMRVLRSEVKTMEKDDQAEQDRSQDQERPTMEGPVVDPTADVHPRRDRDKQN